jgi:hypothetical protein
VTYIIYALADPNTHEVKYVGQTSTTAEARLRHHLGAAQRNVRKPVYDWIRALAPAKPIVVILQTVEYGIVPRGDGPTSRYETTAAAAETKWMKRFERSRLFNSINRNSVAYRRLVNSENPLR